MKTATKLKTAVKPHSRTDKATSPSKLVLPKVILGGGQKTTFIADTLFDDDLKR